MNLFQRFLDLKTKVGGNREKREFEFTFGRSVAENNRITEPSPYIRRILAELLFALQLSERLALLNRELAIQKERRRKLWRSLFFFLGFLALFLLFYELVPLHHRSTPDGVGQDAIGIIGGVDGPTAILISTAVWHGGRILLAIGALILSVVGICKTEKR